jgi:hypothetical protein
MCNSSFAAVKAKWLVIFLFLLSAGIPVLAQQVLHIENVRLAAPDTGFTGSVSLQANLIQNQNEIFQTSNAVQGQYVWKKHYILGITAFNLSFVNNKRLLNDGYQHVRYNYNYSEVLAMEAFAQFQYNEFQALKVRILNGYGPRFTVINNDSTETRLFIGLSYMAEYEEEANGTINRAHRGNLYASFGFPIGKILIMDFLGYYQPDLTLAADYRISVQASAEIRISNRLTFKLRHTLSHDSRPPVNVRTTFYNFSNGLRYRF